MTDFNYSEYSIDVLEKVDWDYICNLELSEIEKEADRKIEENRSAELLKRAGKIVQGEVA